MPILLRRSWWIVPLWIFLLPTVLAAQEPVPLELEAILEAVRAGNPTLEASRIEYRALRTQRRQQEALPDPRVMITYLPYPMLTAHGSQRSQWRVEQAIPFPGTLALRGTIADLGAGVAVAETETLAQDLILQAKSAYYELYRIERTLALIEAFRGRLTDFEEAAIAQYEVGTGSQQAVLKAQLERNGLDRQQLTLEKSRQTTCETLARLVNRLLDCRRPEVVEVEVPPLPAFSIDSLVAIAGEARPEIEALTMAERRAEARIALAHKAYLPEFGVNVTYFDIAPAAMPPTASGRDALALGISVSVPLQRGRLRAQAEEARLRRDQVSARSEALYTAIETHVADIVNQLLQEDRQLALYRDALIPQAETTLEATLSSYATGRTSFLDLLDTERMLFTLQTGYEDAFARYLQAYALLERALGVVQLDAGR